MPDGAGSNGNSGPDSAAEATARSTGTITRHAVQPNKVMKGLLRDGPGRSARRRSAERRPQAAGRGSQARPRSPRRRQRRRDHGRLVGAWLGPAHELEPTVEMLDHRRAALHPVAAIDVVQTTVLANHGMMDVPANNAVNAATASLGGERVLVGADEVDRVLHLELGPLGKRP